MGLMAPWPQVPNLPTTTNCSLSKHSAMKQLQITYISRHLVRLLGRSFHDETIQMIHVSHTMLAWRPATQPHANWVWSWHLQTYLTKTMIANLLANKSTQPMTAHGCWWHIIFLIWLLVVSMAGLVWLNAVDLAQAVDQRAIESKEHNHIIPKINQAVACQCVQAFSDTSWTAPSRQCVYDRHNTIIMWKAVHALYVSGII